MEWIETLAYNANFKQCLLNFTYNFISGCQITATAEIFEIAEVRLSGSRERVHWEQMS